MTIAATARRWLAGFALLITASPLVAQRPDQPIPLPSDCALYRVHCTPGWVGEFTVLAANALVEALTAGVWQKVRGGSVGRGLAQGALGGAVIYAGKRTASWRFAGAGFLGRETAAIGSSIVRNAADGRGLMSRLILPAGPLPGRIDLQLEGGLRARPRLDLVATGWLVYGLAESRLRFDLSESLSSGVAVFRSPGWLIGLDSVFGNALTGQGIVLLGDFTPLADSSEVLETRTITHERIHVVQSDVLLTLWADPLDSWLVTRIPGGRWTLRFFRPNLLSLGFTVVNGRIRRNVDDYHYKVPWELEAIFFEGRL